MPDRPDRVEAITFDFYGTLAYHRSGGGRGAALLEYLRGAGLEGEPWQHQVLYDVFAPEGADYAPGLGKDERRGYLARFAERVFRRLDVRPARSPTPAEAAALWDILGPASFEVYPEVPGVLARLGRAGYRLALISNWPCGLAGFCAELGLAPFFAHVLVSAELGCAKPEPGIFAEACRRLAAPPGRVLHVGDSLAEDVAGARGAGLQTLLLVRGEGSATTETAAIRDLNGLLDHLGIGRELAGSGGNAGA